MIVPDEPQEPQEAAVAAADPQDDLPVHVDAEEAEALAEVDDYRPPSSELVVSESTDVFEVMDAHDVELIIDAMQGRLLDKSLYSFEQGGSRVTELSWVGVRECVVEMHRTKKCRIGIQPETLQTATVIEDGETWYEAVVFAKDEVTGAAFHGYAREPKMMQLKKGGTKPDKFAKTKAINKAERNALRKFIPERLAQTLIAQYLHDERRVKQLRSGGPMVGAVAELPPPVESDEGKALMRECEALWDQITAVPEFAATMTPAHFFSYKTRAYAQNPDDPNDTRNLEQFKATLEQTLAVARKRAGIVDGTAEPDA